MTSKEIYEGQIKIINYFKNYLSRCKKLNINISNSSYCYFTLQGYTPAVAKLKLRLLGVKYIFSYLRIMAFNILGISTLSNYITLKHSIDNKKFRNLVICNVSKKDFKKNGSCIDPYSQTSTRKVAKTLWFLNCVDNYVPKKFDKNLIIFVRKKTFFKHNFLFLIKSFLDSLIKFKFSPRNIVHDFSTQSQFSNIISKKILSEISLGKFKCVFNSTYEGQPFQNSVFKKIKKFNSNVKTIGFFHTPLTPVATSLIYRSGSPDRLLISGNYQKEYLSKYLYWSTKKIKAIPSLRYNQKNVPDMSGYIYLPFNFFNPKKILNEFENYLKMCKKNSLSKFKIKNHVHTQDSKKHKKLIKNLENIISSYEDRFYIKNKQNKSIIIGATSAVVVALQKKIEVIHICEDPIFESYNEKLWKTLKVRQIGSNTFVYKQKILNSLLKFSKRNNQLQKYIF